LDCDGTILWFLYYYKKYKKREEKGYIAAQQLMHLLLLSFYSCPVVWISASIVFELALAPHSNMAKGKTQCTTRVSSQNT
jgi:hypothetical protein